ncbi:MAG: glycosyltransferase family 2 protein [Candidatus Moranbacteria bacterium]|nr:glycosyltransferase family 2 protein [Candidatus Moranbacteria bacterium]
MTPLVPLVGIVVLNFNGQDCLSRSLASLKGLCYPCFFVVVVDNASTDDSLALAKRNFPQYQYLTRQENSGFASGMNTGIRYVLKQGAAFIWLLNNDAWVEPNTLSLLIAEASRNELAALWSPIILDPVTKARWFAKGQIDALRMRALHQLPTKAELAASSYESAFLTGCALLVRSAVLEQVGLLDERFFLYYEDVDFSLRVRAAGFQGRVVPGATVWHTEQSAMNPEKLYHLVLSGLLFFEKWASFWQKPYFLVYTTLRRLKNFFDEVRGRDEARAVRRAYDDFYHGH